ncbi:cellulase family glycosylhydrolase [Carboxylicivirga sp. RSCT41]|uniref:cellulase family glycosylhydrolase n=1 Tax=Carboxylicivirga agarovorans TaxID=3417570 RepID=UPI003D33CE25
MKYRNTHVLLVLCIAFFLLACKKKQTMTNKPDGEPTAKKEFVTEHLPLVYLLDYIKEDGKTVLSWKYNARYKFIKAMHLSDESGETIAEVSFPSEYYSLSEGFTGKGVVLQVENTNGEFYKADTIRFDKDEEYARLLETTPTKRLLINSNDTPYFHKKGEATPYPLYGVNYVGLRGGHSTFEAKTLFTEADYNPYHAETLFRTLKHRGFNFVRVFIIGRKADLPGVAGLPSMNQPYYEPYLDNFIDFVQRAKRYGIYVFPTFGDGELPRNQYYLSKISTVSTLDALMALRTNFTFVEEAVDTKEEYLCSILNYINKKDETLVHSILGFELQNEFALHSHVQPFKNTSGEYQAYWGETYDLSNTISRQKLADDAVIRYQNQMVKALKAIDPELLVAEGFFAKWPVGKDPVSALGIYPDRFPDDRFPPSFDVVVQSNIDFIDIHHYPLRDKGTIQDMFNACMNSMLDGNTQLGDIQAKKPMVFGEFGAFYENEPSDDINQTASRMAELTELAIDAGFAGWCYWTFDTFEQKRILNMVENNKEIMDAISPIKH